MQIQQTIRVARSTDEVWRFLGNVPVVASCIPGAELGEQLGPDRYKGSFRLKVGPVSAKIDGEGDVQRDDAARKGRITGRGIDKRGGSRVAASVVYQVLAEGPGSLVEVSADLDLSGPLAQIGRTGVIEDVARRLTEEFSTAIEAKLKEGAPPPSPATANPDDASVAPALRSPAPAREFDVGSALAGSLVRRLVLLLKRLIGL